MEKTLQQNNLRTLFGVQGIAKTNALKEIVDLQDSTDFNPIFNVPCLMNHSRYVEGYVGLRIAEQPSP